MVIKKIRTNGYEENQRFNFAYHIYCRSFSLELHCIALSIILILFKVIFIYEDYFVIARRFNLL